MFPCPELTVDRRLQHHQCDEGKVTRGSDCSDKKLYNLFQQHRSSEVLTKYERSLNKIWPRPANYSSEDLNLSNCISFWKTSVTCCHLTGQWQDGLNFTEAPVDMSGAGETLTETISTLLVLLGVCAPVDFQPPESSSVSYCPFLEL